MEMMNVQPKQFLAAGFFVASAPAAPRCEASAPVQCAPVDRSNLSCGQDLRLGGNMFMGFAAMLPTGTSGSDCGCRPSFGLPPNQGFGTASGCALPACSPETCLPEPNPAEVPAAQGPAPKKKKKKSKKSSGSSKAKKSGKKGKAHGRPPAAAAVAAAPAPSSACPTPSPSSASAAGVCVVAASC